MAAGKISKEVLNPTLNAELSLFAGHLDNDARHLVVGERDKINGAWQKGVFNNVSITNLGAKAAARLMTFNDWDNDNSKLDAMFINIPAVNFSGMVKLTLFSGYNYENAMGGAEVLYHIGKVHATSYVNEKKVISMSSHFASRFYVGNAVFQESRLYIPITKSPNSRNILCVKIELFEADNPQMFNLINNITMNRDAAIAKPHPWTPQTRMEWIEATPQNGWQQPGAEYRRLRFSKDNLGFVHIQGEIFGGVTAINTVVTTLPIGYRPIIVAPLQAVRADDGTVFALQTDTDGSIFIGQLTLTGTIRINGSFYVGE